MKNRLQKHEQKIEERMAESGKTTTKDLKISATNFSTTLVKVLNTVEKEYLKDLVTDFKSRTLISRYM